MIITSEDKDICLELLHISYDRGYFNMSFCINLFNNKTDTDFNIHLSTKMSQRDLNYMIDNTRDIIDKRIKSFGFKSCDKSLTLFVENIDSGFVHQIEIYNKELSLSFYLNINTNVLFLEELYDMFSLIKDSRSIDVPLVNDDTRKSICIKFAKDEEYEDYSLSILIKDNYIRRKRCLRLEEACQVKKNIMSILEKDTLSVNIVGDYLNLSVCKFGTEYLVDGEISDYSFPIQNKLVISGGIPIDISNLNNLFDGL